MKSQHGYNSSALAMDLQQFCTKPWIFCGLFHWLPDRLNIERLTESDCLGLTIEWFMNLKCHYLEISNTIFCMLVVLNSLECYLHFSAANLWYCSLMLYHLLFALTSWRYEWEILSKLKIQCPLGIYTKDKCNAHIDSMSKSSWNETS